MMKYSIIIPTYNHCDDLLKPCIESIFRYSNINTFELIVVANGCTDNTRQYLDSLGHKIKYIWHDQPLGYTCATNLGLKQARGQYIVLLNNDTELLPQLSNAWLEQLESPFNSIPELAVSGPLILKDNNYQQDFVVFFCAMIRRSVIEHIGYLDEIFNPGYGEDIDFCQRAKLAGYKISSLTETSLVSDDKQKFHTGNFPIWHKSNKTFENEKSYSSVVQRNEKILKTRYQTPKYSIVIPTYNHCNDLLKPCLESIKNTSNMDEIEVIVVANGCVDNTKQYVSELGWPFRLIWADEALGYTRATNLGIQAARGTYVILMNNDVQILPQPQNMWLDMLTEPFLKDELAGITGPVKFDWDCGGVRHEAMAFWLVMMKNSLFKEIGILDEIFSPGMGEDGDFSIRTVQAGYKLISVPNDVTGKFEEGIVNTSFPIYHVGNGTFRDDHNLKNEIIDRNNKILAERYGKQSMNNIEYTIIIPTAHNYHNAFKLCIDAVFNYTDMSNKEIIVIANGSPPETKQFLEENRSRISYFWSNEKIGVVRAYNSGIEKARGKYIILLDDDSILMPQARDSWVNILREPFRRDPTVGASSPFAHEYEDMGFVVHSGCTMYDAELLRNIGMFDEIYHPGYFSDPDVAMKIWRAGRKCVEVPEFTPDKEYNNGVFKINFPVYHTGEVQTMNKHKDIDIVKRNREILYSRYGKKSTPTAATNHGIKYSIVIPTYNHCDDLLKPCIRSIMEYTDTSNVEIIVVANGCTDNTREYVESLAPLTKLIWSDEALGYTKATNLGILAAKGQYVVLLNNDTELLPQSRNAWLNILEGGFADPTVGLTGPLQLHDDYSDADVLIFFCVMIRKDLFDKIGILDEIFSPGGGEDIDFSVRAQQAGYKALAVSEWSFNGQTNAGTFPIWHKDNRTFRDIPEYTNWIVKRNGLINAKKYNKNIKLNLGSGGVSYDKYLSVDLYDPRAHIKMDITKLDFDDNSVSEILASHVFEHLNPYHALDILKDWLRVLKPGGKLIMEMPDIEQLCKRFVTASKGERYGILNAIYGSVNTTGIGGDDNITSPHLFGWYPDILGDHMWNAGFRNIEFMAEKIIHPEDNFRVEAIKPLPQLASVPSSEITTVPVVDRVGLKQHQPAMFIEIFELNTYGLSAENTKGRTVIDIGANLGYFSLFATELGAKKVYAIEAQPTIYQIGLIPHVQAFSNVESINLAVTDQDDQVVRIPNAHLGSKIGSEGDEVKTIKLETFLKRYNISDNDMILKLDCETSEFDILMSTGIEVLRRFSIITLEIHGFRHTKPEYQNPAVIEQRLTEAGFIRASQVREILYENNIPTYQPITVEKWIRN